MKRELEDYRYWLALSLVPEIGPRTFHRLLRHFQNPEAVLKAHPRQWQQVRGIGPMTVEVLENWQRLVRVDEELKAIEHGGAWLVSIADEEYPPLLRTLAAPPPLLYVRGTLEPLDEAALSVIGSRKISRYGRECAWQLAGDLARAGLTIVSGLALGGDGEAHKACLDAGGRTLAVLGSGLNHIYPAVHKKMADQIEEQGALISTLPMNAKPDAGSFPLRNALIAGLGQGLLVVEAGAKSGTFITVNHTLDLGRPIFAVPGDVGRVNSLGTNRLIQEGAHLTLSAKDVLRELQPALRHLLDLHIEEDGPARSPEADSALHQTLLECLERDPLHLDDLMGQLMVREDGPVSSDVLTALLDLEVEGRVRQEPGKRFRRLY